ncbi:hypothetical protein ACHAXR_008289 [Thalassiosira sp. AJA248-18]
MNDIMRNLNEQSGANDSPDNIPPFHRVNCSHQQFDSCPPNNSCAKENTTDEETTAKNEGRLLVDHTYRDFSRYLEEGGRIIEHKKFGANFPAKLHIILSRPQFSGIIAWMPHGRAWKVLDKKLLMSEVAPKYFVQKKFESFTRQLSGWGFKRLHQSGPDAGAYYHECFLRGLPRLTGLIVRAPTNLGKPAPNPDEEPDFYLLSQLYPLPHSPPIAMIPGHRDSSILATMGRPVQAAAFTMPARQSVPNNMVPTTQAILSDSPAAAATMPPFTSMPYIISEVATWSGAQLVAQAQNCSAATSVTATGSSPTSTSCIPFAPQDSSTRTLSSAPSASSQRDNTMIIENDNAQYPMLLTQESLTLPFANATTSAQVNQQPSCMMSNTANAQNQRNDGTPRNPFMPVSGQELSAGSSTSTSFTEMGYPFHDQMRMLSAQSSSAPARTSTAASSDQIFSPPTRIPTAPIEEFKFMNDQQQHPYEPMPPAQGNLAGLSNPLPYLPTPTTMSSNPSGSFPQQAPNTLMSYNHLETINGDHSSNSTQGQQIQPASYFPQENNELMRFINSMAENSNLPCNDGGYNFYPK